MLWQPYLWSMRKMARTVDRVVLLSNQRTGEAFYDRRMLERCHLPFSIIPNGVDMVEIDAARSRADEFRRSVGADNKKLVLNVANFEERKDQALAVRALHQAGDDNSMLVLVGSAENEYARYVRRVSAECFGAQAEKRVRLMFGVPQDLVRAAFCAADVFVLSSFWELQPLVLLEAMAGKTASVSRDVGCVREFPGVLVADRPEELGLRLMELLRNDDLRERLALEGRRACETIYNWPAVIQQYNHLFCELTATGPRGSVA